MKKADWKRRALLAEVALMRIPSPTFDTLTVCWSTRSVTYQGRTITVREGEPDCLSIPILSRPV